MGVRHVFSLMTLSQQDVLSTFAGDGFSISSWNVFFLDVLPHLETSHNQQKKESPPCRHRWVKKVTQKTCS